MQTESKEHFFFSTKEKRKLEQYYRLLLSGEQIDTAVGVPVIVSGITTTRVPGEFAIFIKEVE